ncbi:MAG: cupin domain-containing protein [Candidatus Korobacteraceae bacterium]
MTALTAFASFSRRIAGSTGTVRHLRGALCLLVALSATIAAHQPPSLAVRVTHTDPTKYRESKSSHGGAGPLVYMGLMDHITMDANLFFLHRGFIAPKGGIGHHFHNQVEEMFVIFDGEAQFTVDGRTAVLKGPAGAVCKMGHSHAIYNHTDKPVQWMNINVSTLKGVYDAFDLGDNRVGAPLDPKPVFMVMSLDRAQLRPREEVKGVQYRRALAPTVFASQWAYVDQLLIAPGTETAPQTLPDIGEAYYVMSGRGTISVNFGSRAGETAQIQSGDAIPIFMGETSSFENTGTEPLELMVIGVARNLEKKAQYIESTMRRR